jgi:long-chain acyl-CoA synthetase
MTASAANYPWLAKYPSNIHWETKITPKPLYALLDETEAAHPNRPAMDFLGRHYSYKELGSEVRKLTAALKAMGVRPHTKVGICLPNCPQFIISYFAILRCGATVVNFNPLYSAPEIAHQINDAGVEVMVTLSLAMIYPKVAASLHTTKLKKIIVTDMQDALPLAKALAFPLVKRADIAKVPTDADHLVWKELLEYPEDKNPVKVNPETDLAVLQYTGGTTGVPKGTMLTHANLYVNAHQTALWYPEAHKGHEKMMAVIPLFHVFAMTVVMNVGIVFGSEIILHPRFDLKAILADISSKKPTLMPGVPTLYAAIANMKGIEKYSLRSLKMCFSGGAALPVEVKHRFEDLTGCVLIEGYGLSETSPVVSANPLRGVNKPGSIGMPIPGTIIEVADLDDPDKILPYGETGEICIRGPQVMLGYWQQLTESVNSLRVVGDGPTGVRFYTGDIGFIDTDGYAHIVDRKKEMIISGGYNIYPRHIEEELYKHPAILEAAVIGLKHDMRGEVPKAFVVLREGQKISEQEVKDYLRGHLAAYSIPASIEFRDTLPKTLIGKIDKKALKS